MKCKHMLSSVCCFLFILLGCLCIGFGSWLETNSLFYTSNSKHFSMLNLKVYPVNNINEQITIMLGLWRYCILYNSTDLASCSPVQINFDIDLVSVFHNINTTLTPSTITTYSRFIPLILSTLLAVSSLGISTFLLHHNKKKILQRRALFFVISIKTFLCAVLASVSFGITYRRYISTVESTCLLDNDYICTDYKLNTQAILLGLSIGLFTVSSVHSVICSLFSLNKKTEQQPNIDPLSLGNPSEATTCPEVINEKPIQDYTDEAPQRMSLRPPPPHAKPRPSFNEEEKFQERDSVLIPPTLPFANYSQTNRPPSYGSNHTFGFGRNSPVPDDTSSQASQHLRNHSNTSNHVYMTAHNGSNHTLGGNLSGNTRQLYSSYYSNFNTSFSDSGSQYTNSICSVQQDDLLQQRIISYLNPH